MAENNAITMEIGAYHGPRPQWDVQLLIEAGFEKDRSPLPPGAAGKRLLKDAFKREFPRSANAYLTEAR